MVVKVKSDITTFGIREVVSEGFCIGCGACTTKSSDAKIVFNNFGELVVDISSTGDADVKQMNSVCPFSASAPNETVLAKQAFKDEQNLKYGDEVGFYTGLYAGYSNVYRKVGSSGGIVNWVLSKLLADRLVDKVIVVGRSSADERFFDFKVVDNIESLLSTGTSFYYPVSYDQVLNYIIKNPGRYAITGVPCFHKALRQLKAENPIIAERVLYQIGIVCGQMKSAFYLEYLSRKTGAESPPISACFRRKDYTAKADDYLFEAQYKTVQGNVETRNIRNKEIGANWAMGLFKPRACDFCDDVFAETADIAVMDAWIDKYIRDGKGTSLVIVRTNKLQSILENGNVKGELQIESTSESEVVESQRGGLNHRRVGLRYRLFLDSKLGNVPNKRVHESNQLDVWFKTEQRIRTAIRQKSRIAMRKQLDSGRNGLSLFESEMVYVLGLYKWFSRFKSRIAKRLDYKELFKIDG